MGDILKYHYYSSHALSRDWGASKEIQRSRGLSFTFVSGLLALHGCLGILFIWFPALSTLHALGVVAVGLLFVLVGRSYEGVFLASAYITGAEVLWRMSRARVFWEYGKYATVLVLLGYIVRKALAGNGIRLRLLPILYFSLLLPSGLITIYSSPVVRQDLSFNLSGPFSLAMCVLVFSQFKLDAEKLYRILLALLLPVVAIGARAFWTIYVFRGELTFGLASNAITSGGFGPNQVSAALGLGAMAAVLLAILDKRRKFRILYLLVALWLLSQTFLTFSRGGVLNFMVASIFLGSQYIREPRRKRDFLVVSVAFALVFYFLVFPWLNRFTGSALEQRFTEASTTGRTEIMKADLDLFLSHPLYGVGVGMARYEMIDFLGIEKAAHTEYTRLLAEHGSLGVAALLTLFLLGVQGLKRNGTPLARGLALAFWAWAMAEMAHSAMRIVAISFVFGLSQVYWVQMDSWSRQLGKRIRGPNSR